MVDYRPNPLPHVNTFLAREKGLGAKQVRVWTDMPESVTERRNREAAETHHIAAHQAAEAKERAIITEEAEKFFGSADEGKNTVPVSQDYSAYSLQQLAGMLGDPNEAGRAEKELLERTSIAGLRTSDIVELMPADRLAHGGELTDLLKNEQADAYYAKLAPHLLTRFRAGDRKEVLPLMMECLDHDQQKPAKERKLAAHWQRNLCAPGKFAKLRETAPKLVAKIEQAAHQNQEPFFKPGMTGQMRPEPGYQQPQPSPARGFGKRPGNPRDPYPFVR